MDLKELGACNEGIEYVRGFKTLQEAWDACERGDWMMWLLGRLSGPPESAGRKQVVLIACKCARLSLKCVPEGEKRPLKAIQTAERWAKGKATIGEVRAAAYAAFAAAAATNAATVAANAAAYAAAYAAFAARKETLKRCADIVRKMCPKAPRLALKGE